MQTELCRLTKMLQMKLKTNGETHHGQLGEYCEVELEQMISTSIQRALAILVCHILAISNQIIVF